MVCMYRPWSCKTTTATMINDDNDDDKNTETTSSKSCGWSGMGTVLKLCLNLSRCNRMRWKSVWMVTENRGGQSTARQRWAKSPHAASKQLFCYLNTHSEERHCTFSYLNTSTVLNKTVSMLGLEAGSCWELETLVWIWNSPPDLLSLFDLPFQQTQTLSLLKHSMTRVWLSAS